MYIRISFFPKVYPVYVSYHEINEDKYNLLQYIYNETIIENFIGNEQLNNSNIDIDKINDNDNIIKNYLRLYGNYQFNLLDHILNTYNNQLKHNSHELLKNKKLEYYSDTESSELKLTK